MEVSTASQACLNQEKGESRPLFLNSPQLFRERHPKPPAISSGCHFETFSTYFSFLKIGFGCDSIEKQASFSIETSMYSWKSVPVFFLRNWQHRAWTAQTTPLEKWKTVLDTSHHRTASTLRRASPNLVRLRVKYHILRVKERVYTHPLLLVTTVLYPESWSCTGCPRTYRVTFAPSRLSLRMIQSTRTGKQWNASTTNMKNEILMKLRKPIELDWEAWDLGARTNGSTSTENHEVPFCLFERVIWLNSELVGLD